MPTYSLGLTLTGGAFRIPTPGTGDTLMVDSDALVSGPDAAAYLTEYTPNRVTGDMVRKWAHRGFKDLNGQRRKLEAVDHRGQRGAARYRWSDLLDAERATRRNPKNPGRGRSTLVLTAA